MVIAIVFILLAFLTVYNLTKEQPAIPDPVDLVDPSGGYNPADDSDTVYYSVKGESMFTKVGGVADSGLWHGIRVDDYGRVICAPSSVITVPGWAQEGKETLDLEIEGLNGM